MIVQAKPYRYLKDVPAKKRHKSRLGRAMAVVVIMGGFTVLTWVIGPLLSWQIAFSKTRELISPLVSSQKATVAGLVLSETDLTNAQGDRKVKLKQLADGFSYFTPSTKKQDTSLKEFTVTIPTLRITEARTVVGSEDFEKNLGHLSGTALPGAVGNVFVTGHSSLPIFFSQSNYKTIFANLPKMDIMDEIEITANGKKYTYSVEKRFVVEPTDVSVIEPPDPFGKYLTLMTCVPPGLNTKRLIVLARLVE